MIKSLHIKNFKGWSDTTPIRLAPITLFFGANSSGKSSLAQFLLMLKMTAESNDRQTVFQTGSPRQEDPIDLGSFRDLLHGRSGKGTLSCDFTWTADAPVQAGELGNFENLRFQCKAHLADEQSIRPSLQEFSYELIGKERKFTIGMKSDGGSWKHVAHNVQLTRAGGRQWPIGEPIKFYDFSTEFPKRYKDAGFVQELPYAMENLFKRLCYLGPLRVKALREYAWNGESPKEVGYDGGRFLQALLASRGRNLNLGSGKHKKQTLELIAEELKKLGVIQSFNVEPVAKGSRLHTVTVKVSGSSQSVALPDVGCGISQVLPVLTQLFVAPKNSILIFEQPELHLHPGAQANLADVMIDAIRSKEDGSARNLQLLLESHSEHFLRRLQTRIADGTLKRDEVACYFIQDSGTGGSKLEELTMNDFGYITNWPPQFFGDLMQEAMDQQKAMIERKKKAAQKEP